MSNFIKGVFTVLAVLGYFVWKSAGPSGGSLQQSMRGCDSRDVQTRLSGCTDVLASGSLSNEKRSLAYLKRSNAYFALDDVDHAIADLEAAIALTPNSWMVLHELAIGYREKGQTEHALETMDRVIELNPRSAESYYHRAEMKRALGRIDEAVKDFEEAISLAPNTGETAFLENGKVHIASQHRLKANSFKELAKTYVATGREAEAAETFDRAVGAFPGVGTFYALRASYYQSRDVSRAKADLEKALALDPGEVRALNQRGRLAFAAGDYAGAAGDWSKSWQGDRGDLGMNPAYLPLWIYMLESRTDTAKAASALASRAREINPKAWPAPVASFYLGRISLEQLEAAAASDDQRCEAGFYVAEWHLAKGDAAAARKRFEEAVARCPASFIERAMAETEIKRLKS